MKISPELASYTSMIHRLHERWLPHDGQIPVGNAYFGRGINSIFVQCGRKWGKTELALYFLWRIAMTFPGSPCYYIAPFQKQAKEIVWADPRMSGFGPRDWLLPGSRGVNNTELRLNFYNGSFIKVDGSDNYEAYRGVKYKICVYEEYKDQNPTFRKLMHPNASVLDGLDLYVGTAPDTEGEFTLLANEHRIDTEKFFYQAPTWQNPNISRKWLKKEKMTLYRRNEGDSWEREYAAKFVKGGSSKIFPMIGEEMIYKHEEIMKMIHRDRKKLHWFLWNDPAGATCFATLFVAINPYNKKIFVLDEIYEKKQGEMTTARIGKRLIQKRQELFENDGSWRMGYDEAATWFSNEWGDNFPEEDSLEPSHKHLHNKHVGLTMIKDIMLAGLLHISDRCKQFYNEIDNYKKDKNGKIPKVDDHLIDDFRYILGAESYSLPEEIEYIKEKDPMWRGARPVDDFPTVGNEDYDSDDWGEFNL